MGGAARKEYVILLLFLTIILSFASVSACQYKIDTYKNETQLIFYVDGVKSTYPLLEVRDFQQGNSSNGANAQFKVYNNYNNALNIDLWYVLNGE
jgi:hypothetical protein